MRIEITKQDHVLVFEVAEESGIAVFDKIRKVFNIIIGCYDEVLGLWCHTQ